MQSRTMTVSASIEPSFSDVMQVVFKITGELSYDAVGEKLTFNYRRSGFFRRTGGTETWSVNLQDIREIRSRGVGTEARIRVAPRTLSVLEGLPGDNRAAVVFRVPRADRKIARQIVDAVAEVLADQQEYEVAGVPFRIPDLDSGLKEVRGVMYLEPEVLVLDIESGFSGISRPDRHTVKLETSVIAGFDVTHGLAYDRIAIRLSDQSHFERLPWPIVGKLVLRTGRRNRRETDSIVKMVRMRMDMPVF